MSMSAVELARLLQSGANGIEVAKDVMPPAACDSLVTILKWVKGLVGKEGGPPAADASAAIDFDKVIGMIENFRDDSAAGNLDKMAQTLRRFSERRVMLSVIGRLIR